MMRSAIFSLRSSIIRFDVFLVVFVDLVFRMCIFLCRVCAGDYDRRIADNPTVIFDKDLFTNLFFKTSDHPTSRLKEGKKRKKRNYC